MSDKHFGWIKRPDQVEKFLATLQQPLFADAGANLRDTGKGKTVLLYEAARKVMGQDLDPGPQKIGDCVSWGWGGSVDLLACVEVLAGEAESFSWAQRTCTEAVYALSRVEYGQSDGSYEDGSVGAWAAEAAAKGGYIGRDRLGEYDPKRAKEWGAKGLPDDIEPDAKKHTVKTVSLCKSYEEARDLIANGYPVPVCSGQGFSMTRDDKGYCRPQGTWMHCMKFVGVNDAGSRPALLCAQSWGKQSPTGPKGEHDIPDNSWWVDAQTATRMLNDGDSYAIAGFNGYQARTLDWLI